MWVNLGLSARYNEDSDDSSDSSAWSRCSSPQVDSESLFHSPDGSAFSPFHSPDGRTDAVPESDAAAAGGMLTDSIDSVQQAYSSLGDVSRPSLSRYISSPSSSTGYDYCSMPPIIRRNKSHRMLQTAIARAAVTSTPRHYYRSTHNMSRSMDEAHMKAVASTPELSEVAQFQRSSRSFSEISERKKGTVPTEGERHSAGSRGSVTLVSQVRNSFQQRFGAGDGKRRRRRVAKHIFTNESTQPQLVSLRRFCDEYRTSCLQQNLDERRRSLDRMLSIDSEPMSPPSPSDGLNDKSDSRIQLLDNVTEEVMESCPYSSAACSASGDFHVEQDSLMSSVVSFDDVGIVEQSKVDVGNTDCTVIGTPSDDGLRDVEFDNPVTYTKVEDNIGEQMTDGLEDSVGSCTTMTSVVSATTTEDPFPDEDASPSCDSTVVGMAADAGNIEVLSKVDDGDELVDKMTEGEASAASDLLLSLEWREDTMEEIVYRDEYASDDEKMRAVPIEEEISLIAMDNPLLAPQVQSSTTDEACVEWLSQMDSKGNASADDIISTSTDNFVNLGHPCTEPASSSPRPELSENWPCDVQDSVQDSCLANMAALTEMDHQLDTGDSGEICPQLHVSKTLNTGAGGEICLQLHVSKTPNTGDSGECVSKTLNTRDSGEMCPQLHVSETSNTRDSGEMCSPSYVSKTFVELHQEKQVDFVEHRRRLLILSTGSACRGTEVCPQSRVLETPTTENSGETSPPELYVSKTFMELHRKQADFVQKQHSTAAATENRHILLNNEDEKTSL